MKHVFLDSSPLSLLCNPKINPVTTAINDCVAALMTAGHGIYLPELTNFELRRELSRAGKTRSITLPNALQSRFLYLPVNTIALLRAANLWTGARNQGTATTGPLKLDIDVILAAQVQEFAEANSIPDNETVIATSNAVRLSRSRAASE